MSSNKNWKLARGKEIDLEIHRNDTGFRIRSTRCHEPDELEDILGQISSVRTPHLAPERRDITRYSVPRYPDNYNPLLPLALQKKLDEMSPREYLTYVLNDLTLEERESLMVDEKQRRKSFLVNWPHDSNLSGVKMAQAGFYNLDDYDSVQCAGCRGSLHKWEVDDNPMTRHARLFNNFCRFVQGLECGNRKFRSDILSADDLKSVYYFIQPGRQREQEDQISNPDDCYPRHRPRARWISEAVSPTIEKNVEDVAAVESKIWILKLLKRDPLIDVEQSIEDCNLMHGSPKYETMILNLETEDLTTAIDQNSSVWDSMHCSPKSGREMMNDEDCDSHVSTPDEDDNAAADSGEKLCELETSSKQENVNVMKLDRLKHRLFTAGLHFNDCDNHQVELNDTSVKRFAIPAVPGSVNSFSDKQQKLVKDKENDLENRLNDAGFHTRSTRCHKRDELEDILCQILSVRTPHLAPERRDITCYSVPRYPDNHNPLLPLALQNKLDEMSPREYLTYVLKDLTLEERESLMVDEKQRRKTFLVNWPHDSNLSGVKLAQAGFYSVDDYDRVQCVFCRGSLHKWEVDDNPMTEHARSFNFCRFVKGLECGNREYKNDLLSPEEFTNICLYRTPELKKNSDGSVSTDSSSFGISTKKADMVQYAPEATRLKTFSRWPASSPITAKRLCDAGFYFTGFDDQVRCFYCSGGLREWKPTDDPFEEHARWFPDCSFLIQQKGEGYVNEVHARTAPNKKCTRTTVSQKKAEKEQKQIMTNHQAMYEFCLKMKHDEQLIKDVIKRNNGPFENARDLVEAIYNMEEGDSERNTMEESGYYTMDLDSMPSLQADSKLMGIPEEDLGRIASDSLASDSFPPGMMDGASFRPAPDGSCKNCYRKTGQVVAATQIALPCGHVIYCSQCNAEEKSKVDALSTYRPKCMYKGCGAPMSGTFRVFVT